MKICWDNLENIKLTKFGNFRDIVKGITYKLKICLTCNEDFLAIRNSVYCSPSCKRHTEEAKKKLSKAMSGENNPWYGKKRPNHAKKISGKNNFWYGKGYLLEGKNNPNYGKGEKIRGKLHYNWKGGKNFSSYNTYSKDIEFCEVIRNINGSIEARCNYCGKWYFPNRVEIEGRRQALNGKTTGERRLYCSENCKEECPIFRQRVYPKDFKISTSREVQPELRQMVFERDNYKCVKCGSTKNLHCHHVEGLRWEPIESADINKCMTVCKQCHKKIHRKEGCKYHEFKCNSK